MKIKWKVNPKPTGQFRSFEERGWPYAIVNNQIVAEIVCKDDYWPKAVKSGDHAELKILVYDYSGLSRECYSLTKRAQTLDEVKARVEKYFTAKPEMLPKAR